MDNNSKQPFTSEEEKLMNEKMLERRRMRQQQVEKQNQAKQKRKNRLDKLALLGKIALTAVVVLSLLFVAARALGNVTFTKAVDYISQSVSNLKPGPGYPLSVGSDKVNGMDTLGDCVVLLEDERVILLNSTAKEIAEYHHSYSKPLLNTANGRLLLCDRVTGRFFVADRNDVIEEGELEEEIYCSAIGKKGNIAFSLSSENSASVLRIYSPSYEKLFDFKCAQEYIIGISFSPSGKYIAAIGIGASNASSYSKLYIIDINKKEVFSEFTFEGKNLNSVFYSGKDTVIAVAESSYSIIKNNKDKTDVDFGYNTISRFAADESGNFAVVLSKYGSIGSGAVALLNSLGEEIFSADVNAKIESVDFDGSVLSIYDSNDYLRCYNKRGKLLSETELEISAQKQVVNGKYCYALCYGELVRMDVK